MLICTESSVLRKTLTAAAFQFRAVHFARKGERRSVPSIAAVERTVATMPTHEEHVRLEASRKCVAADHSSFSRPSHGMQRFIGESCSNATMDYRAAYWTGMSRTAANTWVWENRLVREGVKRSLRAREKFEARGFWPTKGPGRAVQVLMKPMPEHWRAQPCSSALGSP